MIPEHFYITSLGVMAYGFIYVPTILAVTVLLWRILKLSWKVNAPITLLLLTLPFWDVYMIGRDADRLCNSEAGLHVYKTVEADGFLGSSSMEYWSQYGYKYVEDGAGKYMGRYTMQDGKVKHQYIELFISRYYSKTGDNHKVVTKNISRSSHVVMDRITKEVLGEWISFNIHPGRFDGVLLKFFGSGPVVWHCGYKSIDGKEINISSLIKATIKPGQSGRVKQ